MRFLNADYASFEASFVAFASSMAPVYNLTADDILSKIEELSDMSGNKPQTNSK